MFFHLLSDHFWTLIIIYIQICYRYNLLLFSYYFVFCKYSLHQNHTPIIYFFWERLQNLSGHTSVYKRHIVSFQPCPLLLSFSSKQPLFCFLFRSCYQSFAFRFIFIMYPDSTSMTLSSCSGNQFVINCY